jgi:DNA-directed RNA polymerase subunit N (RpoN/RPB10)
MTREQFKKYIREVEEIAELSNKLADLGIETLDCKELFYAEEIFFAWLEQDFGKNGADLVSWWLYEDVPKVIYEPDGSETNLENIDELFTYLQENYIVGDGTGIS